MMSRVRKLVRFLSIYGLGRTVFKAAGRLRLNAPVPALRHTAADIGIVGCGQFAFSTIGYFLYQAFGRRIASCYDINSSVQRSFGRAMGVPHSASCANDLLANPQVKIVYVASNHASHADYAISALDRGKDVYIEKPIAVNRGQLLSLLAAKHQHPGRVFAGYNRPFSAAIQLLRREVTIEPNSGISMQCFVSGHQIAADHWYRRPEEGTRICGNVGHWLDLWVHVLAWRGLPDVIQIALTVANDEEPDDNLSIGIRSDRGDIFSVMLTSRCEPFEGINETINFQHLDTICKIDDFRRVTIWKGERLVRKRHWPKDVGHRMAILQPFQNGLVRDWLEVVRSTLLMLHITDMVRDGIRASSFSFVNSWADCVSELGEL